MTAYPLLRLEYLRQGKTLDVTFSVTAMSNSTEATVQMGRHHIRPYATRHRSHANGTNTRIFHFSVPWSVIYGRLSINVTCATRSFQQLFLIKSHSQTYYATLIALLVLVVTIAVGYVVYRLRSENRTPYIGDPSDR